MSIVEIRTIWKTASMQCELVWGQFGGYRLRLWIRGRLLVDELMTDLDAAFSRAAELRQAQPDTA